VPQHQPAERDQGRRLRLALAEFLHEAMRLLARVRREPLRLLAEFRVQVVVGVARRRALARRPARIVRPFTLFIHGHSFAAIPLVRLVRAFSEPGGGLSRLMGTSVEQIDRTYGHRLPDSLELARTALDSFLTQESSAGRRVEPASV
jgi:hypothetical protein